MENIGNKIKRIRIEQSKSQENVSLHLKDKNIIKEIVVVKRLVNFVIK